MQLFTDGSVHPPSRIGYGAYLVLDDSGLESKIQLKRFEDTASSQLEIQTLIWALSMLKPESLTIYTDSQTIIGLPGRRSRLEERNYQTRNNTTVKHADLYREFFRLTDSIACTFMKVKGHRVGHQKTEFELLFTKVDRASRRALRHDIENRI